MNVKKLVVKKFKKSMFLTHWVREVRLECCQLEFALEAERQAHFTLEWSFIAHQELFNGLMGEVGAIHDDHARLVQRVVRGFPLARAEVLPQCLVEYGGCLVPIGTTESPIYLIGSSENIIPDSEAGEEVLDFAKE
jgi:hypothetical protein